MFAVEGCRIDAAVACAQRHFLVERLDAWLGVEVVEECLRIAG